MNLYDQAYSVDFFLDDTFSSQTQTNIINFTNESLFSKENANRFDSFFLDSNNLTYSPFVTVLIACIATLMSFTTIIGNVFVIVAFIIEKSLRKYSNYFILNLSIADLLIGILIPPYAPFLLYKRNWRIGRIACTTWLVFDYVVGSASVLCIVVISLDRFLMVSQGLNYVASQKISKAIIIMSTTWIIAFLNYGPAIIFWELISGKQTVKDGECQVAFHDNLVYLTATACVEFFVPLISICGLNLAVYLNIRKRSRGLIRTENPKFLLNKSSTYTNINNNNNANNVNNNSNSNANNKQVDLINVESTGAKTNKASTQANPSSKQQSNENSKTCDKVDDDSNETSGKQHMKVTASSSKKKSSNQQITSENSSTYSTSSVDDVPVRKSKREEKPNSKTNTKDKKDNECSTLLMSNSEQNTERIKNSNSKNSLKFNVSTKNSTFKSSKSMNFNATTKTKKSLSSRTTLNKDKKAARSLFILVFVFVCCWVNFKQFDFFLNRVLTSFYNLFFFSRLLTRFSLLSKLCVRLKKNVWTKHYTNSRFGFYG